MGIRRHRSPRGWRRNKSGKLVDYNREKPLDERQPWLIVDGNGRRMGRAATKAEAERIAGDWRNLAGRDDVIVERSGSG